MTRSHSPDPIRVLVLMPMLPGYEGVRASVAATIASAGMAMVRLEDLLEDWEWLDWLYRSVPRCDLVVADPSRHNAFVMYELAIARAHARPALVILDEDDSQLSGSLDGSPFLPYDKTRLDLFSERLAGDLALLAAGMNTPPDTPVPPARHYRDALRLLAEFRRDTGNTAVAVDESSFATRLCHSAAHGTFREALAGTPLGDAGLLSALVRASRMVDTMTAIRHWITVRTHH